MRTHLYEGFHGKTKAQKRIINNKNFTYRVLIDVINNNVHQLQSKKVLDIGCGAGTVSFYLASKKARIWGIDISQRAIQKCVQTAKNLSLQKQARFFCGTLDTLKNNSKFDLVICSEVIEHIENDREFLKDIYKILKKGSVLILSTPSKNAPLYKIGFARKFDKRVGHLRRYLPEEIEELVKSVGFSIKEVKLTEGVLRNFLFLTKFGWLIKLFRGIISDLVTLFDNISLKIFGESQIFIVAVK